MSAIAGLSTASPLVSSRHEERTSKPLPPGCSTRCQRWLRGRFSATGRRHLGRARTPHPLPYAPAAAPP
eukprot:CAMPEP_0183598544 /NCGR_PEP_ID=MMETSP0371-20130417/178899_1 /TAXON_ID=268820 /ORGANISM="Peridinium aciculiferum, Strain PAER-2" /LENGTH=68 /DNA_ID=CAMNT_0025810593 /DNA_START=21 /DNA_END=223 /DNA_ORIENTATION=-